MDVDTLKKANELNRKIREFSEALNCFEENMELDPEKPPLKIDLKPKLIIEFDKWDDCDPHRQQIAIPGILSDAMINILKEAIIKLRDEAQQEFDKL